LLRFISLIAVSIGFLYKKLPTIGVIYNPFLNQLYSALKGKGAFLNGSTSLPLHPPGPFPSLSSALMAVEYGSDRSKDIMELKARSFTRLAGDPQGGVEGGRMGHSLRSIGSAALNYAFVASGSLDIYWYVPGLSGDMTGPHIPPVFVPLAFREIGCWWVYEPLIALQV
jgi:myo-inositol-1(or 4)-monophosphatase